MSGTEPSAQREQDGARVSGRGPASSISSGSESRSAGCSSGDPLPTERELRRTLCRQFATPFARALPGAAGVRHRRNARSQKSGAVLSARRDGAMRKLLLVPQRPSRRAPLRDVHAFHASSRSGVRGSLSLFSAQLEEDLAKTQRKECAAFFAAYHGETRAPRPRLRVSRSYRSSSPATVRRSRPLEMLRPVIEEIMHVGKKNRAAQEQAFEAHGELVAALRAKDRVAYAYLLGKHLEFGLRFVEPPPNE